MEALRERASGAGRMTVQLSAGEVLRVQDPNIRHQRHRARLRNAVAAGVAPRMAGSTWIFPSLRTAVYLSLALSLILLPGRSIWAQAASANTASTQTDLKISADNSTPRTKLTLTAHVESRGGLDTPTGIVNFRSGSLDLGSAVLDGEDNASLTTNNLSSGAHQIVALYRGDAAHQASLSPAVAADSSDSTVAGFTVTASPTTLNLVAGAFGTSIVTITPVNGFSGYVSLSCNGLPVDTTCNFTPTTTQAACTTSGTTTTCPPVYSTLQIQTQAQSTRLSAPLMPGGRIPVYAILFPAVFGIAGWKTRRKKAGWNALLMVILFAGAMGLTACNVRYDYEHHGPPPNPGTPSGTSTVTIDSVSTLGSLITTPPTSPQITVTVTNNAN